MELVEKKLGFFERFKKKSKEEPESAPDETESAHPAGEEVTSDIPETVPDDLADLSSLTDGMDDADKTPMEASDNTESVESTENAAENGDAGGLMTIWTLYLREHFRSSRRTARIMHPENRNLQM